MKYSLLFMIGLACLLTALAWHKGPGVAWQGARNGLLMLSKIGPVLIPAFVLAGMMQVLVPQQTLSAWLGADSGLRGVVVGAMVGAVTPGGPFVLFPILAVLLKTGVGMGVIVSFLSSWALIGLHRMIIFEVPMLGLRFAVTRILVSMVFPVIIGLAAQAIWDRWS